MANEDMTMSEDGYKNLRFSEGVVLRYYDDAPVNGNCSWGVGTLEHYGPCSREELARTVLPDQVNAILKTRVQEAEKIVRTLVKQHQLTQAQFDAAVSFSYNSRTKNIKAAMSFADNGDMSGVAAEFMRNIYIIPRKKNGDPDGKAVRSRGLEIRRRREALPFVEKGNQ